VHPSDAVAQLANETPPGPVHKAAEIEQPVILKSYVAVFFER